MLGNTHQKPTSDLDALAATAVANHFEGARTEGKAARLVTPTGRIACQVGIVSDMVAWQAALVHLDLSFPALGIEDLPVRANGMGSTTAEAVAATVCAWACAFGPVLLSAHDDQERDEVETFSVPVSGSTLRGFASKNDAAVNLDGGQERPAAVRERLGGVPLGGTHYLFPMIFQSGIVPPLLPDRTTVISIYVGVQAGHAVPSVEVDGIDVPDADRLFPSPPYGSEGAFHQLRELVVLRPQHGPTR